MICALTVISSKVSSSSYLLLKQKAVVYKVQEGLFQNPKGSMLLTDNSVELHSLEPKWQKTTRTCLQMLASYKVHFIYFSVNSYGHLISCIFLIYNFLLFTQHLISSGKKVTPVAVIPFLSEERGDFYVILKTANIVREWLWTWQQAMRPFRHCGVEKRHGLEDKVQLNTDSPSVFQTQ